MTQAENPGESLSDGHDVPVGNVARSHTVRAVLFIFGIVMVAIGIVGIFVPGLPTTVFLLAAAWAFSRSSERLQYWLWTHKRLGPPVRNWYRHRVIPPRAKVLAVLMMVASEAYMIYLAPHPLAAPLLAAILVPAGIYIVTRASYPPKDSNAQLQAANVAD